MDHIIRITTRGGVGGVVYRGDPEDCARLRRASEQRGDRVDDGPRPMTAEEALSPRQRHPKETDQ